MVCCFNVVCFFCMLCVLIGLASLIQFCMGLYFTFLQTDIVTINQLVKTDKFDSYLAYVLIVFIGLGVISLMLVFFSIYGIIKRNRPLSIFVAVLWAFSLTLNLVMLAVSLLYYYFILSQLRPLLIRSLQQSPVATVNLLDTLQLKYTCCGIDNKNDYNNLSVTSFPSSCCRVPNCWQEMELNNNNNGSTNGISSMHSHGCYSMVKKYLTIELWILIGVTGLCGLLQILAIVLLCILNQRYEKFDNIPKLVINHLTAGVPINSNNYISSAPKIVQEPVEITQI